MPAVVLQFGKSDKLKRKNENQDKEIVRKIVARQYG